MHPKENTKPWPRTDFDVIATKTGFDTPASFEEVAVSLIFNTQGGNAAFLGDALYINGYRMVVEKYKIDLVTMNMGNKGPGYTDKTTPWDLWRITKALNAKVVITMPHDNWGNCHKDPSYLVYIVARKSKEPGHPEIKTVVLYPGARYVHPDDQDIGRYTYPDWRELCDRKKSVEYGQYADWIKARATDESTICKRGSGFVRGCHRYSHTFRT